MHLFSYVKYSTFRIFTKKETLKYFYLNIKKKVANINLRKIHCNLRKIIKKLSS